MQNKTVNRQASLRSKSVTTLPVRLVSLILGSLLPGALLAATELEVEQSGRIKAARANGLRMPCRIDLRVVAPGWRKKTGLESAVQTRYHRSDQGRQWDGRLPFDDKTFTYTVLVGEAVDDAVPVTVSVTAQDRVDLEGVYLFVEVPAHRFQGGSGRVEDPDNVVHSVTLPLRQSGEPRLMEESGSRAVLTDVGGREELRLNFRENRWIYLQDDRRWSSATFALYTPLHEGGTTAGQTVTSTFDIEFVAPEDGQPAVITIEPGRAQFPFEGFGGNYCFELDSAVTAFNRQTLRSAWVRMEMSLYMWEPENDNKDASTINWIAFEKNDIAESPLRRELTLMRDFEQDGSRLCLSIWHLPAWMYAGPRKPLWTLKRRLKPDMWDEVAESLGAFLLYAKHKYDVEPELISFNEPDLGVYTYLDLAEHREALMRLGSHLRDLKLSTKILIGDTGSARTIEYAEGHDDRVLAHAGALAFHTWKSDVDDYAKWRALATRLKLPLYVTEAGVDAGAHRTPWKLDAPHYALDELRLYQELLRVARPQGVMYWQFAPDYRLAVAHHGVARGGTRHAFMKHFCNLTPSPGIGFWSESSSEHVQASVFADGATKPTGIVVHVANYGAKRPVTVSGIPSSIRRLIPVVSTSRKRFSTQTPLIVVNGRVSTELPAESMVSLTSPAFLRTD
jgi:O-glycosyl hydrolase